MNDRYDALERLQRLRESGALTDEEFELEKKRLIGGTPAAPPPAAAPFAEADGEAEARRNRNILYILLGGGGLLVAILLGVWLGRDVGGGNSAPEANVTIAQDAPPPEENAIAAAVPPANVRTLPMPEQLSRAFAAAFGTAGSAALEVAGRTINYKPGQFFWIGDRGVLISPGTAADDCHAAPAPSRSIISKPPATASRSPAPGPTPCRARASARRRGGS